MLKEDELIKAIQESGYKYKIHKHAPLHTVQDSVKLRGKIEGSHSKNLFLKNKKNQFFLFSCLEDTRIDLKKVSMALNAGNISFANEKYLYEYLGVSPGSVTPFGLLNDKENSVFFCLDKDFLNEKIVNFHPLTNTSTLSIEIKDFIKFLIENNKKVNIFDFSKYSLI
tara:strand:- start:60 stop:563 length:504 start_codon:yes stop_codon:yes gene_type:complete